MTYTLDIAGYELRPAVQQTLCNADFEDLSGRPKVVITADQAKDLFSGRPARMLVAYPPAQGTGKGLAGPCFAIDFAPGTVRMYQVVEDVVGGLFADPFLSDDGDRLVYGSYPYADDGSLQVKPGENGIYAATVRERKSGSAADRADRVLIAEHGFNPRWWRHPRSGEDYIIYVSTPPGSAEDISGITWIQQVERGGITPVGPAKKLIPDLALRGGRSPDGRFMCTTLPGFALVELKPEAIEDAYVNTVFSGKRVCNGTISTDPAHPDRFTWIDPSHAQVHIQERDKKIAVPGNAPGYSNIQWSRWATAGDWLSASPAPANDDATPSLHDAWVYRFSTKKWTQITKRAGSTHLWVGGGEAPATVTPPVAAPATSAVPAAGATKADTAIDAQMLWSWSDGHASLAGRRADGKPLYPVYTQPERLGAAYFTGAWSIRIDGGGFIEKRGGEALVEALRQASGLSLSLELVHRGGTGRILSLGEDLILAIGTENRLDLSWTAGGKPQHAALGTVSVGTPTHLVVTLSAKGPQLWRNGVAQRLTQVESAWDASAWKPGRLVLGRSESTDTGWSGELRAINIYGHVLDATAVATAANVVESLRAKRPKVEQVTITATLKEASTIAPPSETVYRRTFAWFLYEVTSGSGSLKAGTALRIGRWTEMDNHACLAAQARSGQNDTLIIEPFAAHEEMEAEQAFDTTGGDQPEWFEVAPLAWAKTETPARSTR